MKNYKSVFATGLLAAGMLSACNKSPPVSQGGDASPNVTAPVESSSTKAPVSSALVVQQLSPAIPEDLRGLEVVSSGECGIEATTQFPQQSELALSKAANTMLEGWSVVRESADAPDSVYFKLDSGNGVSYFAPVEMVARAGLGVRLNDPALDRAGYRVNLGLEYVEPGNYSVQLAQRLNSKAHLCATGRKLVVTR